MPNASKPSIADFVDVAEGDDGVFAVTPPVRLRYTAAKVASDSFATGNPSHAI
jgi:hypothetical protein